MRLEILLAALLVAGTPLTGCLTGGETLDPTSAPAPDASDDETGDGSAEAGDGSGETDDGSGDADAAGDGSADASGDEAGNDTDAGGQPSPDAVPDEPLAVIAHVDTGINPYHEAFRDDSALAHVHPSEYIDGYPEDATALNLTLDADSWQEAFEADRDVWANVSGEELYWIPGTRIDGAITFGDGGTYCPLVDPAPANAVNDPRGGSNASRCTEHPILDDFGHGTMTASRMAGDGTSLCPDCRIVSIEGLGSEQTLWAAETGWIDVQTNSWGSFVPDPASSVLDEAGGSFGDDIEQAAGEHLVYFASGNGFAGFFGFTPWPTHVQPTHVEGVVSVGAHDNGRVAHWQGTPPHVVADGYRGLTAGPRNLTGVGASPFVCCTSASSPYAAGIGARLVQEAREVLDDPTEGPEDGVLASGTPPSDVADGPLEDGDLTLDELRELVKDAAEPRPSEGRHDGATHWTGDPAPGRAAEQNQPWGPAGNPYCPGCWTAPASWEEIPSEAPAYPIVGYGGATPAALQDAIRVLEGEMAQPDRGAVDEYFQAQEPIREAAHDPAP